MTANITTKTAVT